MVYFQHILTMHMVPTCFALKTEYLFMVLPRLFLVTTNKFPMVAVAKIKPKSSDDQPMENRSTNTLPLIDYISLSPRVYVPFGGASQTRHIAVAISSW